MNFELTSRIIGKIFELSLLVKLLLKLLNSEILSSDDLSRLTEKCLSVNGGLNWLTKLRAFFVLPINCIVNANPLIKSDFESFFVIGKSSLRSAFIC